MPQPLDLEITIFSRRSLATLAKRSRVLHQIIYLSLVITPKTAIANILLFLYAMAGHSQKYAVCDTTSTILTALNTASLSNPTFSLQPGNAIASTGTFFVKPSVTTVYTLYVTGTNSNSILMTTSSTATVEVVEWPNFSFSLPSPTHFTLGCGSQSMVVIGIVPIQPTTGITFTWLPPGSSTLLASPLSTNAVYTITAPGNHLAVVQESVCGHTTRIPVSILSITASPVFDSVRVSSAITCTNDSVTAMVFTHAQSLAWNGPFSGTIPTGSIATLTVPGNYTVSGINSANSCPGQTVVNVTDEQNYPIVQLSGLAELCTGTSVAITATVSGDTATTKIQWFNTAGQVVASGAVFTATQVGVYLVSATNEYGCTTVLKQIVTACTALHTTSTHNLNCYPNPLTDVITFSFPGTEEQTVLIYNSTGVLIKELMTVSGTTIDLSDLEAGIYLVACREWRTRIVKM